MPDARSFFVGLFTLSKLPDEPMRARAASGQVGHFNQRIWDFQRQPGRVCAGTVINRWRLEEGPVRRTVGAEEADRLLARQNIRSNIETP